MKPITFTISAGQSQLVPMNINNQQYNVMMDFKITSGASVEVKQTADAIYNVPNPSTNSSITWYPAQAQSTNPSAPTPDTSAIVSNCQLSFEYPSTAYLFKNNGTTNATIVVTQQGLQ